MPIMIPPTFLDVPAIVRIAAHSPASPAQMQHPMVARPPTLTRPNDGTGQTPTTITPVPPVPLAPAVTTPPASGAAQSSSAVPR